MDRGYGAPRPRGKPPLVDGLANLIWPPRSLLSDAATDRAGAIPAAEWLELSFLRPPWCATCAWPFETPEPAGALCPACIAAPPAYDSARAALAYDDAARKLVLDLKRAGRRDGLPAFGAWMRQACADQIGAIDLVTPAPLHWLRLTQRTFNQALWLAEAVAAPLGLPIERTGLQRVKARRSQEGLSRAQRAKNVAGAYRVRPGAAARFKGKRVLLIDDVHTTGATLNACAKALKKAGASHVTALTLARVVRPADLAI